MVAGNQSSGKSSVVAAMSGVSDMTFSAHSIELIQGDTPSISWNVYARSDRGEVEAA